MDQFERNKVINAFKKQEIPILVATDVAGKLMNQEVHQKRIKKEKSFFVCDCIMVIFFMFLVACAFGVLCELFVISIDLTVFVDFTPFFFHFFC